MKCISAIEEMREELRVEELEQPVEELNEFEVIELWLEAAQVYHKELRGMRLNE